MWDTEETEIDVWESSFLQPTPMMVWPPGQAPLHLRARRGSSLRGAEVILCPLSVRHHKTLYALKLPGPTGDSVEELWAEGDGHMDRRTGVAQAWRTRRSHRTVYQ